MPARKADEAALDGVDPDNQGPLDCGLTNWRNVMRSSPKRQNRGGRVRGELRGAEATSKLTGAGVRPILADVDAGLDRDAVRVAALRRLLRLCTVDGDMRKPEHADAVATALRAGLSDRDICAALNITLTELAPALLYWSR